MLLAPHPPYKFGVYLGGDIPFYSHGNWLNWSSKKKIVKYLVFLISWVEPSRHLCRSFTSRCIYAGNETTNNGERLLPLHCIWCTHYRGHKHVRRRNLLPRGKKPFFVHYYYYYRGTRKVTPTMYTIQSNVASMYVVLFSFPNHRYDTRKYWLKTSLFQQFQN